MRFKGAVNAVYYFRWAEISNVLYFIGRGIVVVMSTNLVGNTIAVCVLHSQI